VSTIEAAAAVEEEYASDAIGELIETGEASVMHARDLLLALAGVRAEQREVKALRDAIRERYDHKLSRLAEREAELAAYLHAYVVNINDGEKVAVPDAGTAYLTTKNKGGKIVLADAEAFREFVTRRLPKVAEAASETVTVFNERAALELATDELAIRATPDGKIVDTSSGEVVELPGIGAEPESKTLAVRSA
jgi:hypothetical protein